MERDLSGRDYVYIWVDGIHTGVRLGENDRLCCLVMVGAMLSVEDVTEHRSEGETHLYRSLDQLQGYRGLGTKLPIGLAPTKS
jgi:hypothetical protein